MRELVALSETVADQLAPPAPEAVAREVADLQAVLRAQPVMLDA